MLNKLKLNLGCGSNKIAGYVNIDMEKSCKPDKILDFVSKPLPYKGVVHEILLFHTIEHLRKDCHRQMLGNMYDALKPGGKLLITYPNFWECAMRWKDNFLGKKKFWEATLFGRQAFASDYHVCAMDPVELQELMSQTGFIKILSTHEKDEPHNSVTVGYKGKVKPLTYEQVTAQVTRDEQYRLK